MPKTVSLPELWHTAVVEWHEQAPFRNTLGRKLFEGVLQVLYRHLSSKSFNVRVLGTLALAKTTDFASPNWRGNCGAQH